MSYIIGKSSIKNGYINILPGDIPEDLKRKRIIIEELDEKNNVKNRKILSEEDKDIALCALIAKNGNIYASNQEYLDQFSEEEIELVEELM